MVSPSGDQQDVDQLFSLFRHRPGDVEGRVPQPRPIWGQSVHQHCWHLITLLYLNWEKAHSNVLFMLDVVTKQRRECTHVKATEIWQP